MACSSTNFSSKFGGFTNALEEQTILCRYCAATKRVKLTTTALTIYNNIILMVHKLNALHCMVLTINKFFGFTISASTSNLFKQINNSMKIDVSKLRFLYGNLVKNKHQWSNKHQIKKHWNMYSDVFTYGRRKSSILSISPKRKKTENMLNVNKLIEIVFSNGFVFINSNRCCQWQKDHGLWIVGKHWFIVHRAVVLNASRISVNLVERVDSYIQCDSVCNIPIEFFVPVFLEMKGCMVFFDVKGSQKFNPEMELFGTGRYVNNLFVLNLATNRCLLSNATQGCSLWYRLQMDQLNFVRWNPMVIVFLVQQGRTYCVHRRMGHLNQFILVKEEKLIVTDINWIQSKKYHSVYGNADGLVENQSNLNLAVQRREVNHRGKLEILPIDGDIKNLIMNLNEIKGGNLSVRDINSFVQRVKKINVLCQLIVKTFNFVFLLVLSYELII